MVDLWSYPHCNRYPYQPRHFYATPYPDGHTALKFSHPNLDSNSHIHPYVYSDTNTNKYTGDSYCEANQKATGYGRPSRLSSCKIIHVLKPPSSAAIHWLIQGTALGACYFFDGFAISSLTV